jgi:uncharacterized protein
LSVLVKPELKCNMQCKYCYEQDTRHWQSDIGVDVDKAIKQAETIYECEGRGNSICAHGGEPLLLPKTELEKILQLAHEKTGYSSIQTNGTLIDEDHIKMFKQYKTGVGISIDGRWPLNEYRWAGSEKKTKEMTEKTIANIYRLVKEGVAPGLIIVISKANGTKERLPVLKGFLQEMCNVGVASIRLNLAISDKCGLAPEEAKETYLELCKYTLEDSKRAYLPFRDMVDNLLGLGMGTCVFTKCDFYHTEAARVVLGDGSRTCCLKTAGSDRPFIWDSQCSDIRYQILGSIPRDEGGCSDCRYWRVCYGFCPSETPGGDWRNRAIYCEAYYACFKYIENRLKGILPNVVLVPGVEVEDEQKDYHERKGNCWHIEPFKSMSLSAETRNPSTWKETARQMVYQNNSKGLQFEKYKQAIPGKPGYYHADHADQGGCK